MKETPCICSKRDRQHFHLQGSVPIAVAVAVAVAKVFGGGLRQTYPLVHVDGVLAGDNVLEGGPGGLASLLGGRHFCRLTELR